MQNQNEIPMDHVWSDITGSAMADAVMTIDMNRPQPPKRPINEYEIWIGNRGTSQGEMPATRPVLWGRSRGRTFEIACYRLELQIALEGLDDDDKEDRYIDAHFGKLYYNPKDNSNFWIGKFYQTEEEAWASFTHGEREGQV